MCALRVSRGINKNKFIIIRWMHDFIHKHIPEYPYQNKLKDLESIEKNINLRKVEGNMNTIKLLLNKLESIKNETERNVFLQKLKDEMLMLPNDTHPSVVDLGDNPKEIAVYNTATEFKQFKPRDFAELSKKLNLIRTEHLGNFTGHKSYYLLDSLAEMEQALTRYTLDHLRKLKFNLFAVPDVLPPEIIEGCGMKVQGERTQVYKLFPLNRCLSGTSEMALAGYFKNKVINKSELPLKVSAVSRCFRAETSSLREEKGIYRVHQFTKVEMFSVCSEEQSESMLENFKEIQINLFKPLGLHFKLLDMPPVELGASAYRKYDIEAWMPGRNMWGEISSCSNCTDYQAKRLNITYKDDNEIKYVHTVNGTACAIPRMLIALLETFQRENGTIVIPKSLQPYMNGQTEIKRKKALPELKLIKNIEWSE